MRWELLVVAALACVSPATAHDCVHDDVLHEHLEEHWDTPNVGLKDVDNPDAPEQVMTRRQLVQAVGKAEAAHGRRLETQAQYLARSWGPVRINVDFIDIRSDPDMTTAKADFLEFTVIPQAVARLSAALEVRFMQNFQACACPRTALLFTGPPCARHVSCPAPMLVNLEQWQLLHDAGPCLCT